MSYWFHNSERGVKLSLKGHYTLSFLLAIDGPFMSLGLNIHPKIRVLKSLKSAFKFCQSENGVFCQPKTQLRVL